MGKFSPFFVQFDKPTWNLLKELREVFKTSATDTVIMLTRVMHRLITQRETMLTETGRNEVRKIVAAFKNPTGVDNQPPA